MFEPLNEKLLIVDDTEENIYILVEALGNSYDLTIATTGQQALDLIKQEIPDLILLDIMMPEMDGFEVCQRIKEDSRYSDIPIIFLTAVDQLDSKTRGFKLGAVDYITKPFEIMEVCSRVETHLTLRKAKETLKNYNKALEQKVLERTQDLIQTQDVTINCIASLAESRDPETGGHIKRTQHYVRLLAEHLQRLPKYAETLTNEAIDNLFKTAPLHDIGKVGIPDNILLKPGKLNDEEFEIMKQHANYGNQALQSARESLGQNSFLTSAEEITLCHHEKWDGTGYPNGLKGDAIPLSGRLMALADVYDALISKRVYKPAFNHKKAVELIVAGKGTHFDPDLVDAFLELQEEFRQTALRFKD